MKKENNRFLELSVWAFVCIFILPFVIFALLILGFVGWVIGYEDNELPKTSDDYYGRHF